MIGKKRKTHSFLDLGPIGLLVLFGGRQLFSGRHLMMSGETGTGKLKTYCCYVVVIEGIV